ncbi:MAG TPA: glycine cleavage system protein H [Bryobacteraceae bacterium]|nr:glycine cleavage system protein H [Bryobacteraceae bacterium]
MTVLLMLATFLTFAVVDYLLNRKKALQLAPEPRVPELAYVDGFLVPENVRFHPGHTWAMSERRQLMRVGMDEFAAALAGKIEKIELPKPGTWIRQGQKMIAVTRGGERTELVSPVEGEVTAVNETALADPKLLRSDPYGNGWLLTVSVPDEENTIRNLLPLAMVRAWMRDAVSRLYALQPQLVGAVAADGGRPVEDLLAAAPQASWTAVTRQFFLTE